MATEAPNLPLDDQSCKADSTYSLLNMSTTSGTFRGTPNGRGTQRGQMPTFVENSPSNIPRPKLESHASSAIQSDIGMSTLSASRQKQSKRDEVSGRTFSG